MFRCDFCDCETSTLYRVALDRGYNRMNPHKVKYACKSCSDLKEKDRLAKIRERTEE